MVLVHCWAQAYGDHSTDESQVTLYRPLTVQGQNTIDHGFRCTALIYLNTLKMANLHQNLILGEWKTYVNTLIFMILTSPVLHWDFNFTISPIKAILKIFFAVYLFSWFWCLNQNQHRAQLNNFIVVGPYMWSSVLNCDSRTDKFLLSHWSTFKRISSIQFGAYFCSGFMTCIAW